MTKSNKNGPPEASSLGGKTPFPI